MKYTIIRSNNEITRLENKYKKWKTKLDSVTDHMERLINRRNICQKYNLRLETDKRNYKDRIIVGEFENECLMHELKRSKSCRFRQKATRRSSTWHTYNGKAALREVQSCIATNTLAICDNLSSAMSLPALLSNTFPHAAPERMIL